MKKIGTYLIIAGIASIVLSLFDYNLSLLVWIDNWGPTIGWVIRAGFIVVGLVLFFVGKGDENEEEVLPDPKTEE